jgi:hypothetical protein
MGVESGRNPGAPDRNVETSANGGCSDEKALLYSSCRSEAPVLLRKYTITMSVSKIALCTNNWREVV